MSELEEQIAKLISDAERKAYARGLQKAVEILTAMLGESSGSAASGKPQSPNGQQAEPPADRADRGKMALVRDVISGNPGLRGVDIVRWLENRGTPVAERTVRTCLRRLREDRAIWQRSKRWYSRNTNTPEEEQEDEPNSLPF